LEVFQAAAIVGGFKLLVVVEHWRNCTWSLVLPWLLRRRRREDSDDTQRVVAENYDIAAGGLRISESSTTLAHLNHQLSFSL
jgi:hypothetical protein